MQADLGGAFYEMAIRDHVKMDVLTRKAAELQRLDIELGEVEEALAVERSGPTSACENCGAEYEPGRSSVRNAARRSAEVRAVRWLIDTAGSITGTRFRLVIASSTRRPR